ncbi:STAS/SEC14 domain-containing protein [Ramlibacter pallidus]|uniref:STAS/SEC14 domain-containing protein n=1 Tax=Ramlibacter pallidus TaxID=2780087 RepID=A0ABR9S817_9BURK|nr:STAS/SEC14 domain-containing protein [Ramlibacter pallidus]
MSFTLHLTHGPAYAVAEISALAFMEAAPPVLRAISEQTRMHGDRRLLINLIDVVGTFGAEEQRTIGLLAHQHLSHLEKVASLVPPEKLTRVSEAAARAQGMELRVFTALTEAIDWLVA